MKFHGFVWEGGKRRVRVIIGCPEKVFGPIFKGDRENSPFKGGKPFTPVSWFPRDLSREL